MADTAGKQHLTLRVETAEQLMSENPISIRDNATVREALAAMLDRDISAAPVIAENGRPVGVISVTDILIHEREAGIPPGVTDELESVSQGPLKDSMQLEIADPTTVDQVMTPGVFSVPRTCSAEKVVEDLLRLHVHHLFVEDDQGVLVGVISTSDVLRHLTK